MVGLHVRVRLIPQELRLEMGAEAEQLRTMLCKAGATGDVCWVH